MKKMIIQILKYGYAELNFEYLVDVPNNETAQFIDELEENDIDTIKQYPHFIIKDYRTYIEEMGTESFTIDPTTITVNMDITSLKPKRLVPHIQSTYYHGEEISLLLSKASRTYEKHEFEALLENIEKEISKLEILKQHGGVN